MCLNAAESRSAAGATLPIPSRQCSLCGEVACFSFEQRVLQKYDVSYFRCRRCDLIQSEQPYWLDEAYSSAISSLDTGAIARNLLTAELTEFLAWMLGIGPTSRCLDYGGGHGVFVRTMRDRGFDFRLQDRYAENLFARGFAGDPRERYDLVTCFEVFEHFPDVGAEAELIFSRRHDFILVSTMLHRGHRHGWWYYGPDSGQHVAFYSKTTMSYLGRRFGYIALCGGAYTLFIREQARVSDRRKRLLAGVVSRCKGNANPRWMNAAALLRPRYEPLTLEDNAYLISGSRAA